MDTSAGGNLNEKQPQILVVNNDINDIIVIEQVIKTVIKSVVIENATSLQQYRKKLRTCKPDLIISEISVPGFSLLTELAEIKDSIPIVIFSSAKNEEEALKCLNLGAWDFVSKEFPARLPYSILKAIENRRIKTDLVFAEKDLSEFENYLKKYRHWESNIPAVVYNFLIKSDDTFQFTYISSASDELLGLPSEAIVRDPLAFFRLVNPDDLTGAKKAIKKSALTLSAFSYEMRLIVNKETRWFSFMSNPVQQPDGDILWSGIMMEITDRKKVEEALTAEHNLMQMLMDNSTDTIYFKDLESRFIKVNKQYVIKYGFDSEKDVLGKTDFDIFEPGHANAARKDELKIIATGKPIIDKLEKETWGNNKVAWVSTTKTPLTDANGNIAGTFGVSRDFTERKQVEESLDAERNLMKTLIDAIPDHIFVKNTEGKFVLTNKATLNFFGAESEDDVKGKSNTDLLSPELAEKFSGEDNYILETGENLENREIKIEISRNKTRWFLSTKVPLFDREGNITGIVGINHDHTKSKNIQEKLKSSEERLRFLISSTSVVLFSAGVLDNFSKLSWVGDNVTTLLGYTPEEVLKPHWWEETMHPDDYEYVNSQIKSLPSDKKINLEFRLKHVEGHYVWVRSELVLIYDSQRNPLDIFGSWADITERMMAQDALLTSEEQLSYALKMARLAHWEYDVAEDQLILNDQFYTVFRTNVEKEGDYIMSSAACAEKFFHPDDVHLVDTAIQRAIKTEDPEYNEQIEFRVKYSDGKMGYMLIRLFINKDENGKTVKVFGIIQDITEHVLAEEALRKSESQLSNALKITHLAYWECDLIKRQFHFNDQFYSLLRTTAEKEGGYVMDLQSFLGRFIHPEDMNAIKAEIRKALKTTDPNYSAYIEHKIIYSNGETGYNATRFNIIKDKKGRIIKTYGANQDITERRGAEKALRASEYILKKSQSVARIGSYKYDLRTNTWESSKTLDEIFGIDEKYSRTAEGQSKLIHPEQLNSFKQLFSDILEGKRTRFETEFKIIRQKDGQVRWVLSTGDVELDKEGKPLSIIGTHQDITERILREQEKQELEKQVVQRNEELEKMLSDLKKMQGSLVQSEKMASLGQLSAGIAHEINNPLAYVSSNSNRLKEYFHDTIELLKKWQSLRVVSVNGNNLDETFKDIDAFTKEIDMEFILKDFERMIISIQDGTQRIKKIIDGMRGFAHISDKSFLDSNLNHAVDDTLTILWNEIKYKTTIEKEYGNIPLVSCNIGEIKQVLVNLIINAAHAITDKGVIKISTFSDDSYVSIKVQDSGNGIPPEQLKRIFDPFFTTKPVGVGTGLGLWISSTIIEKHSGTLTVESTPGTGSTFTIKLPIKQIE